MCGSLKCKKIITTVLIGLTTTGVFANNSDIKVNAKIASGCLISTEDIHFGIIDSHHFLKNKQEVAINKKGVLSFKCSRGTNFTLVQDGGVNRYAVGVSYWENAMKRNGVGEATVNDLIHYSINVPSISSEPENYTITRKALNNHIISNTPEGTHYLALRAVSGEESKLPYEASISQAYSHLQILNHGDYSDTISFVVTY